MRGINTWSFNPYRQLDDGLEYGITVCRLAPNTDTIELEWLVEGAGTKIIDEFEVNYKLLSEKIFTVYKTKETKARLSSLTPEADFELYVSAGSLKSRKRLVRTGFVPGNVVNYLHPKDDAYKFSGKYLCSPSIVKLKNGVLLASMDIYAPQAPQNLTLIFRSDDKGETWQYQTDLFPCFWGKLFIHMDSLYMLAMSTEYGDLLIGKSNDEGKTFCKPEVLFRGSCSSKEKGLHKAPMPVTRYAGRLWTAIDYGAWSLGGHSSSLLSIDEKTDLMQAENWVLTKPLLYNPGWEGAVAGPSRGCLEGSAVVAPNGEIVNILGYRTNLCEPDRNKAVILKGDSKQPEKQLELYKVVDFPGNLSKFCVLFDNVSGMYFSIVNRIDDSREDINIRQRNIASLSASADLEQWQILCDLLDYSAEPPETTAFQYVDFAFDNDDIIFLSRTAFNEADSFHDSNYITFHRVKNFRSISNETAGN